MRGGLDALSVRRTAATCPSLLLWRPGVASTWQQLTRRRRSVGAAKLGPQSRPGAREMHRAGGTLRAAALRRAASRSCSSRRRLREDAPSEPPSERELHLRAELLECTARESPAPPARPGRGPATCSRDARCSCAAREGEYFYAAQLPGALTNRGGAQHVIRTHARPLPPRYPRARYPRGWRHATVDSILAAAAYFFGATAEIQGAAPDASAASPPSRSAAAATWDALGARPYNASWCAPSLIPIRDLLPWHVPCAAPPACPSAA